MKQKMILLIFAILLLCAASLAQDLNKDKLDSMFNLYESHDKAMGSLVISQDGRIVYHRWTGSLFIEDSTRISADAGTKYRIGSITKMFTTVLVFQLVEAHKLRLDECLADFFPQVPNANKITIAQLLSHRSGLHNYMSDTSLAKSLEWPHTEQELLTMVSREKPDFEPGLAARYSNTNFLLLGYIVEKIEKKPYSEVLKKRILSKIGLNSTYCGSRTNVMNGEAYSYAFNGRWVQKEDMDMSISAGAGAIVSTPADLVRFIEALFAGKLISPQDLSLMKTQQDGYGMGMFERPFETNMGYGHNGLIDGFTSTLTYFPASRLAVAYCSNGGAYEAEKINDDVLRICNNRPFMLPSFSVKIAGTQELDKYLGEYSSQQMPMKIIISKKGLVLLGQYAGQEPVVLEPIGQESFSYDAGGIVLLFDSSKAQFILKQHGASILYTRDR